MVCEQYEEEFERKPLLKFILHLGRFCGSSLNNPIATSTYKEALEANFSLVDGSTEECQFNDMQIGNFAIKTIHVIFMK